MFLSVVASVAEEHRDALVLDGVQAVRLLLGVQPHLLVPQLKCEPVVGEFLGPFVDVLQRPGGARVGVRPSATPLSPPPSPSTGGDLRGSRGPFFGGGGLDGLCGGGGRSQGA